MNELEEFKKTIIEKFSSEITDRVFLMIQNDRELFHSYMKLIQNHKQNFINSSIAKEVKKSYNLRNKDLKIKNPKSFLIQSHESFEPE